MSRMHKIELVDRISDTGEFIKINEEKCDGCGKCALICPMTLWKIRGDKAYLSDDYTDKCMECGSCWQICKNGAVEFSFPKGGSGIVVKQG